MAGWQAVLKNWRPRVDTESQCQHHIADEIVCKQSRSTFYSTGTARKDEVVTLNNENSYSECTKPDAEPQNKNGTPNDSEASLAYESGSLLKGFNEILIHHNGETYRLRLTKNNKLILHK